MDAKRTRAFAALGLLIALPAGAQEREADAPCPAIVTSGEAVVRAAPDRAFVDLVAEARAREPEAAQREAANAMASVQAKLKSIGVSTEAIRTLRYDLQPEYDHVQGRQTLRGYVVRNAIEVRVDDLSRVGPVIDAAVQAGATSVSGIRFALKQRDELERQALTQAVADGRARVRAAAARAGVAVERIWSIEEQRLHTPVPMMSVRAEGARDVPTPIAPGPVEIRATVTLTACIP